MREAGDGQGMLLSSFTLLRLGTSQQAANDPAKRALLEQKDDLEQKIDTLKYQKAAMDPDDYKKQLTDALVRTGEGAGGAGSNEARSLAHRFVLLLACVASRAQAAVLRIAGHLRKHGHTAQAQDCFDASRAAPAPTTALKASGDWNNGSRPTQQFRLATQPADSKALYKVRWGMLLHERFNDTDAADLFHEALEKDPSNAEAYVGLAIVSADGFDGQAAEYLGESHRARSKARRGA